MKKEVVGRFTASSGNRAIFERRGQVGSSVAVSVGWQTPAGEGHVPTEKEISEANVFYVETIESGNAVIAMSTRSSSEDESESQIARFLLEESVKVGRN